MAPTWLITGCSAGFGSSLARHVLTQGHNVIATSRNPAKTPDLVNSITARSNGRWIALDVTASEASIRQTINEASSLFGGVDIVVNNAARAIYGAAEDIPEADARAIFETNYWGPRRVINAVLPQMRERKSGTIVNVSSIAGLTSIPAGSTYAGSKWALEALSESLYAELAPFNIRVLTVEPGAFRTGFLTVNTTQFAPLSEPYRGGAVEKFTSMLRDFDGKQPGDPDKGAARIYEMVTGTGMCKELKEKEYLRLVLGLDCWTRAKAQVEKVRENILACEEAAPSTDFE